MTQIQNIQHQSSSSLTMSATPLWSDIVLGFTYNNEPKTGKTGV